MTTLLKPAESAVQTAAAPVDAADLFADISLDAALHIVQEGLQTVSRRLSDPDMRSEFARFSVDDAVDAGNTVPGLLRATQSVLQLASGVQARLDGITAESFAQPAERAALLGLPAQGKIGFRNPGEFLQDTTSVSRHAAAQRVRDAENFQPHRLGAPGSTDEMGDDATGRLGSLLPEVAAGFADCSIGADRLRVITGAVAKIRAEAELGDIDLRVVDGLIRGGDAELAESARVDSYAEFRATVARWRQAVLMLLNPEDPVAPGEREAYRRRGLRFIRQDGEVFLWEASLTQEGHELLRTVEAAANNPRRRGEEPCDAQQEPVVTDERSRTQRAHDGLLGVLGAGLRDLGNGLPSQGGARPQLHVTAGLGALMRMAHRSGLLPADFDPALLEGASSQEILVAAGYSGPAGASMLRRMLCNAEIIPVVLGTDSEVLDVAVGNRLFSAAQRRALVARDGGCAIPGCTFPAAWCESHHIVPWAQGGPTSIDNGVLLCTHHHHSVHEDHWIIRMHDGVPWFTPTASLAPLLDDAERQPRRNRVWRDHPRRRPRSISAPAAGLSLNGPPEGVPEGPPENGPAENGPPGTAPPGIATGYSALRHTQLTVRCSVSSVLGAGRARRKTPRRTTAPAASAEPG
ncbi:DUF222 domain-containing protein [Micrococcaceae sp. AOP34-BR2-30]